MSELTTIKSANDTAPALTSLNDLMDKQIQLSTNRTELQNTVNDFATELAQALLASGLGEAEQLNIINRRFKTAKNWRGHVVKVKGYKFPLTSKTNYHVVELFYFKAGKPVTVPVLFRNCPVEERIDQQKGFIMIAHPGKQSWDLTVRETIILNLEPRKFSRKDYNYLALEDELYAFCREAEELLNILEVGTSRKLARQKQSLQSLEASQRRLIELNG